MTIKNMHSTQMISQALAQLPQPAPSNKLDTQVALLIAQLVQQEKARQHPPVPQH